MLPERAGKIKQEARYSLAAELGMQPLVANLSCVHVGIVASTGP
jgi:hypothetical protein